MRRVARGLLLLFAFTIPWEYSLELGEPWGNIARIAGLLLLLAAVPAVFETGRARPPGLLQWLVLALFLWFCLTCFWSIEPAASAARLRGYFQEMAVVWLVWEFAESAADLRWLLRVCVAGSWVLAALTLANFASPQAIAAGQIRFAAAGQDPNDVARFLDLGFPLAALLARSEPRWAARALAVGYLPLGVVAVLLTASRGGFLAALVALAGSVFLLVDGRPRRVLAAAVVLPAMAAALWFTLPYGIFERLATIPGQLQGGDLNQRLNIWNAGWTAFARAPFFGSGAGSFVGAAGLAAEDTAHNTALAIAVSGGLCALFLATAIVAAAARETLKTRRPLQGALATALLVWLVASLVSTLEESRATWLLLAMIALAGRLAGEAPGELEACFPGTGQPSARALAPGRAPGTEH